MVQVKFRRFGSNTAFGCFAPGDLMRTSEAMAQHLVDQGVAEFVQPAAPKPAPIEAPVADPAPVKPRKSRKVPTSS